MPRVQQKRGTAANLTAVNPTPLAGELLVVTDENSLKVGNGTDAYTSLSYVTATPRSHKSTHATGGSDALSPSDIGAAPAASPAITGNATFTASSGVPVTVTNTGSGNSFVVNDAAGDTTPFVVDAAGNVLIGSGSAVGYTDYASMTLRNVNGGVITLLNGSGTAYGELAVTPTATYFKTATSQPLWFGTSNAERMRLTADGDLGLGPSRTAPASRLDVNGVITVAAGSAAAPAICASGDANSGLLFPAADTVAISTAGSERLRVDSAGNVGIGGTASGNTLLHLRGTYTATSGNAITTDTLNGVIPSTATTAYFGHLSRPSTQAAAFTLPNAYHFAVSFISVGAGSSVSAQTGFFVGSGMTQATNNYGFRGSLANASGRFNVYMDGTAPNYMEGNVGLATTSPTAKLDINADTIRLRTAKTPASASDTGNTGDICWDADYLYVCTATNTWKRAALSTW
jgi:hypothetical protein